MKKWKIASVIPPECILRPPDKEEQELKLRSLLEEGYEPFAIMADRIWLRIPAED